MRCVYLLSKIYRQSEHMILAVTIQKAMGFKHVPSIFVITSFVRYVTQEQHNTDWHYKLLLSSDCPRESCTDRLITCHVSCQSNLIPCDLWLFALPQLCVAID